MALNLENKKAIVAEVAQVAADAVSAVAADYRGLTVAEMTELRAKARKNNVYLRVVRNTLARRAVADTDFACMHEALIGPLFLAFSTEDPGAPARLLKNFAKDHERLEVKALAVSGKLLAANELDRIAALPTKDQAIAMFMSVLNAPIIKLVRTLAEPAAQVTRVMAAVADNKKAA